MPEPEPRDMFACKRMMAELVTTGKGELYDTEKERQEEELIEAYMPYWYYIRTHEEDNKSKLFPKLSYVIRKTDPSDQYLAAIIRLIHAKQQAAYRLNIRFSFLLKNYRTGKLKLYPHSYDTSVFVSPPIIDSGKNLEEVIEKVSGFDFQELVELHQPNCKWKLLKAVGFTIVIFQIPNRVLM